MSAVDKAELQRIAQQVELNRKRMESIEQQTTRLEQIRLEQLQTIETLSAIPDEGAKGAMIPLGSGVQIVTDIPPETGAVIDIGSRVQAEKTLSEAIAILTKRTEEILEIMNKNEDRIQFHRGNNHFFSEHFQRANKIHYKQTVLKKKLNKTLLQKRLLPLKHLVKRRKEVQN